MEQVRLQVGTCKCVVWAVFALTVASPWCGLAQPWQMTQLPLQVAQLGVGDAPPPDPEGLLADTSSPAVATRPPVAAFGSDSLPMEVEAVLTKKFPAGPDDLWVIQDRVVLVLEQVLPATVGIELGDWTGSGVVVSADGLVLTAGHVVGMPEDLAEFVFPNGRRARGRMLGINRHLDCGMMQISDPAGPWPFLPLAPPGSLQPGNWVVATGQPGGVQFRRTPPVRLGRVLTIEDELINTDCTLVGGDSGGPLVDLRGRLVGIHSRIGEGLTRNFHVPIDTYLADWQRLLAGEMWGGPLAARALRNHQPVLGLAGRNGEGRCRVTQVFPYMPAEVAGLRIGDILLTFDSQPIESFQQLSQLVKAKKPGDLVAIEYQRNNKPHKVQVRLAGVTRPLPGSLGMSED